jgi:hypothetical protein
VAWSHVRSGAASPTSPLSDAVIQPPAAAVRWTEVRYAIHDGPGERQHHVGEFDLIGGFVIARVRTGLRVKDRQRVDAEEPVEQYGLPFPRVDRQLAKARG